MIFLAETRIKSPAASRCAWLRKRLMNLTTCQATHRPIPSIVLVEPIMGENIGAAARAMKNFHLENLILVKPKDGWPNPLAETCATTHAVDIIKSAKLYETLDEALSHENFDYVYAATARPRHLNKPYVFSRDLYQDYPCRSDDDVGLVSDGRPKVALMFGRESSGLTNEEVSRANKIVTIDASPDYPVINLAQSIVIIASQLYQDHQREIELRRGPSVTSSASFTSRAQDVATQRDILSLLSAIEEDLSSVGFFEGQDEVKKASVLINLRGLVMRVPELSKNEVAMVRGALKKLKRSG